MLPKLFSVLAGSTLAISVQTKSKCPFGFTSGQKPDDQALLQSKQETPRYPADILQCTSDKKVLQTEWFTKQQYEDLVKDIIEHQHTSEDKAKYAACILRLEGHDLMDFRLSLDHKGRIRRSTSQVTGGSDGCVNFEDPDNVGLPSCLTWTGIESVYNKWCEKISLADFLVVAGEAVVGSIAVDYHSNDQFKIDTLLQRFRDQFEYGRKTAETCPNNHGLMPNPENGCDDLKHVFITHIFDGVKGKKTKWGMTAALSGAHTIGSAKPENSGYDGMWGDPLNQAIFNNDYYKNIMLNGWGPKRAVGGNLEKNQWALIDQSLEIEKNRQMMLNSDMCLFYQDNRLHAQCMEEQHKGRTRNRKYCKKFEKKGTFLYAKNSTCCAWTQFRVLEKRGILKDEQYCGLSFEEMNQFKVMEKKMAMQEGRKKDIRELIRPKCCQDEILGSFGDCDSFNWPKGPAMGKMLRYATSNDEFYTDYLIAWKFATENGWVLKKLE